MDYRDLAEVLSTLRAQAVQFEQAHEAEQSQQHDLWQANFKPRLKDLITQLTNERAAAKADLARAEADVAANEKALNRQSSGSLTFGGKLRSGSAGSPKLQQMSTEQLRSDRERIIESVSTLDKQLSGVRAQLQRQQRPDERAMYEDQHMMLQARTSHLTHARSTSCPCACQPCSHVLLELTQVASRGTAAPCWDFPREINACAMMCQRSEAIR